MESFQKGLKSGLDIGLKIAPYIIPVYIFVDFFKKTESFVIIGKFFKPLMSLLGLPGEASLVLLSGFLINLYAAIGAMAPLNLTVKQITIIGLVLGIAHNLIIESLILSKSGVRVYITVGFRVVVAFLTGMGINLLWNLTL